MSRAMLSVAFLAVLMAGCGRSGAEPGTERVELHPYVEDALKAPPLIEPAALPADDAPQDHR